MVREWIVFFGDTGERCWWDLFTKPGFRHVLAVGWDADLRIFVMFDPSRSRTEVLLKAWGQEGPDLASILFGCRHAVRFTAREERTMTPLVFGCVGAIKGLLGIDAPLCVAPHHLWKHLLANGGEPVDLPEMHSEGREAEAAGRESGDQADAAVGSRTG